MLIFSGCNSTSEKEEIYSNDTGDQILLVSSEEWIIFYSGVATLCDRFEVIEQQNSIGVLTVPIPSKYYRQDSLKVESQNGSN